ncbi:M50 family metallopeptidase [Phycicoccus avicenniae]|uniref:M50 family metallopeptidase n=1 Tax=Phycicoccus avicenniae TaxID=2828860 RepID=UPI003D2D3FB1
MDVGQLWERLRPVGEVSLDGRPVLVVLVAALVAVGVEPVWRVLRLGVTLVHELGHAGVGILCGRRFTGFVLRGDMSGHAVTVGPARGFGRVATTWAGYPAPAVVGAGAVWLAVRGWGPVVLAAVVVVLLVALVRSRSLLTAVVVLVVGGLTGWLWWAGAQRVQAQVLVGVGIVLVVGAWRHLGAVAGSGDRSASDAAVLAQLTRVPRVLWLATFALVCAAATWVVATTVLPAL